MASRLIDNLIAARLLYMLVTPFEKTEAFKLGIVDANGKVLRPASTLKTDNEKDAYNYLTRLVFNVKRLINKLPGGENNLKNLTAAYFMVKEKYEGRSSYINERQFNALVDRLDRVTLVEEQLAVEKALALQEEGEGGTPANVTGAGVSTDKPVVKKKDIKKYQKMNRRSTPMNVGC
jgi:hypothetical protein